MDTEIWKVIEGGNRKVPYFSMKNMIHMSYKVSTTPKVASKYFLSEGHVLRNSRDDITIREWAKTYNIL